MINRDISDTADIETSSDEYAKRFLGKTGEWMLKVQAETVLMMLKGAGCKTVIDVGGGHGQLAAPLSEAGFNVTVLGSAEECRHRVRELVENRQCAYITGSIVNLPFPDRSFDAVTSVRLMAHCTDWRKLLSELCRVAKKTVIVDFAPSSGFNALAPVLFGLKKQMEGDTRKYRLIGRTEVKREFDRNSFEIKKYVGEFLLPMVLHRMIQNAPISKLIENCLRRLKTACEFGSPVILQAMRKK